MRTIDPMRFCCQLRDMRLIDLDFAEQCNGDFVAHERDGTAYRWSRSRIERAVLSGNAGMVVDMLSEQYMVDEASQAAKRGVML